MAKSSNDQPNRLEDELLARGWLRYYPERPIAAGYIFRMVQDQEEFDQLTDRFGSVWQDEPKPGQICYHTIDENLLLTVFRSYRRIEDIPTEVLTSYLETDCGCRDTKEFTWTRIQTELRKSLKRKQIQPGDQGRGEPKSMELSPPTTKTEIALAFGMKANSKKFETWIKDKLVQCGRQLWQVRLEKLAENERTILMDHLNKL